MTPSRLDVNVDAIPPTIVSIHDPFSVAHYGNKSSPHRPYMWMQISSRLYNCCRCHDQVIVCSDCDRGQRYCTKGCRHKARKASLKRASKKYQESRAGRFNNAARQNRFRQRKKHKVTHHCSLQIPPHAVLKNKPECADINQNQPPSEVTMVCHHCHSECGPFLRSDFLRRSHIKPVFRRHL